ncbi:membrane or secreted protein [Pedobacter sp. SYP-B3415]|uniref:membrane or secreted protein n=1 Tax=Pedobacter sp. SYP-B3415 TaxID=2496641 RepID=UPI00101D2053|nr:membrane or secreted protein [Pedobacter sp. SYP-B3415]
MISKFKKISALFFLTILCMASISVQAQTTALAGAWQLNEGNNQHHLFFQDGYFFHTVQSGSQFLSSQGGTYEVKNNAIAATILYDAADSTRVGSAMNVPFSVAGDKLVLQMPEAEVGFTRVDDGKAPLAGVWRITGRAGDDGKVANIHQTGTRQTYKLLTGTKFQWVAIDPGKKQFSGTGGGSYTFTNGKYTEKIEFFSRDASRVGASLTFDGKLQDGHWHHSGLSSKGAKIYEVWSRVNK